jgi:hypothetical protein
MKGLARFLLALALLCPALTGARGAGLEQSLLINGRFGGADDEYGFEGIADEKDIPLQVVSSFAVASTGIFVFDSVKDDIKVYSLTGEYMRTIQPLLLAGDEKWPLNASDILVAGNEIYLLVDAWLTPSNPGVEWSRFQVFLVDIESGKVRDRHLLKNPDVGTYVSDQDGQRHEMNGTVQLAWRAEMLSLYDHYQQMSYPVGRAGDTADALNGSPIAGSATRDHRIREDVTANTVELLDSYGQAVRVLPAEGTLIALASDSDRYVTSRSDAARGYVVALYTVGGGLIGEGVITRRGGWPESPGSAWQAFELHDIYLYELVVDDTGVQIVKWHAEGGGQ